MQRQLTTYSAIERSGTRRQAAGWTGRVSKIGRSVRPGDNRLFRCPGASKTIVLDVSSEALRNGRSSRLSEWKNTTSGWRPVAKPFISRTISDLRFWLLTIGPMFFCLVILFHVRHVREKIPFFDLRIEDMIEQFDFLQEPPRHLRITHHF